jgi:hypothetical protein
LKSTGGVVVDRRGGDEPVGEADARHEGQAADEGEAGGRRG